MHLPWYCRMLNQVHTSCVAWARKFLRRHMENQRDYWKKLSHEYWAICRRNLKYIESYEYWALCQRNSKYMMQKLYLSFIKGITCIFTKVVPIIGAAPTQRNPLSFFFHFFNFNILNFGKKWDMTSCLEFLLKYYGLKSHA